MSESAIMKPVEIDDSVTGNLVRVELSPFYSILKVNERCYYFSRETGEYDGTSIPMN